MKIKKSSNLTCEVYATITRTFEKGKLISEKLNVDWDNYWNFDDTIRQYAEDLASDGCQINDIRRHITYCNADIERNYNRYETHHSGTYKSEKFYYMIDTAEFVFEEFNK